jgi:carboxyl-terminal processing protease
LKLLIFLIEKMKKNIYWSSLPFLFVLLGVGVYFGSPFKNEGEPEKDKILLQLIWQALSYQHYQPKAIDDAFSENAYQLFLNNLDNGKRFLWKNDIKALAEHKKQIDEQVQQGSYDFFEQAYALFTKRIEEARKISLEILESPFDFEKKEEVELDGDKLDYVTNEKEWRERWRKNLKYQTLMRLDEMLTAQEDSTFKGEKKDLATLEKEAREKVSKSQKDYFERLRRVKKEEWQSVYINSLLNVYDPHTQYFPPKEKADFDISFSGKLEGIGATLQEREGYIRVANIVVGSPSWKQGQLKENDVILKVAQGDGEPVDIVGMRLDEAVQLIRGKKGTEVRLTVKKVDGSIVTIPIIRDVVVLEETYAKSAVLENKNEPHKIGYIKLPSFYSDMGEQQGARSCAEDVKKELLRLKAQNVDGIILDLRNNGGGSLYEVVNMVGLFIETGPVVQVKAKGRSPQVLEDRDKGVIYRGPLVVMVNEFSASASEIFAAAIQDYGRGVVVGSNATFGKGTVQQFYDLDAFLPSSYDAIKPLGAIKLTTQKFYRINGGATQLRGVVPDIVLPDLYSYANLGEKEDKYAMEWDEIKRASYKNWDNAPNLSSIREHSKSRIEGSEAFQLLNQSAERLKKRMDETSYPLQLEAYRQRQKMLKEESKRLEQSRKEFTDWQILPFLEMKPETPDSVANARIEQFQKELRKDIHLFESINILKETEQ